MNAVMHPQLARLVEAELGELRLRLLHDVQTVAAGGHCRGGIREAWKDAVRHLVRARSLLGPAPVQAPAQADGS